MARFKGERPSEEVDVAPGPDRTPTVVSKRMEEADRQSAGTWLEGEVVGVSPDKYHRDVTLYVSVPGSDRTLEWLFELPRPFDRRYHLTRIMKERGLESGDASELIGDTVRIRRTDPDGHSWEEEVSMNSTSELADGSASSMANALSSITVQSVQPDAKRGWEIEDPKTFKEELQEVGFTQDWFKMLWVGTTVTMPLGVFIGGVVLGGTLLESAGLGLFFFIMVALSNALHSWVTRPPRLS